MTVHNFSSLFMLEIQKNMRQADRECDIQCNLVWDGFGRWVTGYKWLPYMNFTGEGKQAT